VTTNYISRPPLLLGQGSGGGWKKQVRRIFNSLWRIVWQTFVPFNPQPEPPDSFPAQSEEPDAEQVKRCEWIFDQAETRRNQLEQKAQWTFALILFLTPLVASVFVFMMREETSSSVNKTIALTLLVASMILMLMGFVSIMRAVSIQARESLFLGSVADLKNGQLLKYDKSFLASGLLYCASVNTAMNDHLAQFVKGAHILTIAAVIALVAAALPAGVSYSDSLELPTSTKIVGSVTVSSAELKALAASVAKLRADLAASERRSVTDDRLSKLEARIDKLEAGKAHPDVTSPAGKAPR
jgi:hypothetical protein